MHTVPLHERVVEVSPAIAVSRDEQRKIVTGERTLPIYQGRVPGLKSLPFVLFLGLLGVAETT